MEGSRSAVVLRRGAATGRGRDVKHKKPRHRGVTGLEELRVEGSGGIQDRVGARPGLKSVLAAAAPVPALGLAAHER